MRVRAVSVLAFAALILQSGVAPANPTLQTRAATQFLAGAPREVRRLLCSDPGSRPALVALGEVLERNTVSRQLLFGAVSNIHNLPFIVPALKALPIVDRIEGVGFVLERLASSGGASASSGPAFELVAGAALSRWATRPEQRLVGIGTTVGGHELDGLLSDGTRVEMKHVTPGADPAVGAIRLRRTLERAQVQLQRRCERGQPAMLVLPELPGDATGAFAALAHALRGPLTVMAVDVERCTARQVFPALRPARDAGERARLQTQPQPAFAAP